MPVANATKIIHSVYLLVTVAIAVAIVVTIVRSVANSLLLQGKVTIHCK